MNPLSALCPGPQGLMGVTPAFPCLKYPLRSQITISWKTRAPSSLCVQLPVCHQSEFTVKIPVFQHLSHFGKGQGDKWLSKMFIMDPLRGWLFSFNTSSFHFILLMWTVVYCWQWPLMHIIPTLHYHHCPHQGPQHFSLNLFPNNSIVCSSSYIMLPLDLFICWGHIQWCSGVNSWFCAQVSFLAKSWTHTGYQQLKWGWSVVLPAKLSL